MGAFGALSPNGLYVAPLATLIAAWTVWLHRWPTSLPMRLRAAESPQGPDERAVMVGIRQEGALLGWDVGILWFEKAGVGFVGQTVSFVLPRASMQAAPSPHTFQTIFRAPQLTAKVFETVVGIVPLGEEMKSQMTLARIDALPGGSALETVLPPTAMHPELLHRALTVKRRLPLLTLYTLFPSIPIFLQTGGFLGDGPSAALTKTLTMLIAVGLILQGRPLPDAIRARLPKP